jgi:hypothetical protein
MMIAKYGMENADEMSANEHTVLFPKVERRKNNRLGLIKDYRNRYSVGDLICGIAIAALPVIVITILAIALG